MASFGTQADPLAITDHQITKPATGVELIEHPVCEIRPWYEFEIHVVAGGLFEILGQFNECVRWIPGCPTKGEIVSVRIIGNEARGSG